MDGWEAIDDKRSRVETPINAIHKFVDWVELHARSTSTTDGWVVNFVSH